MRTFFYKKPGCVYNSQPNYKHALKAKTYSYLYLATFIAALGGFLFGFDTGIISGALTFLKQTFPMSTLAMEWVVSNVLLGALFGALLSGSAADYFGRHMMLVCAACAFLIGTLLITLASQLTTVILGRFVVGLAIGLSSYITPLFISEIAPAEKRGFFVLLNAVTITGGEATAFLVDYLLTPTGSWRLMFATGLLPAVLLFVGMLFMPATPRWQAAKGLIHQAKQTLQKIRGHHDVELELHEIIENLNRSSGHWQDLLSPTLYPILLLGIGLGILQQFVGINTVMYYGPLIFKQAGFNAASTQILATFGMGVVNTLMSIVGVFVVDKLGRRKLLLMGLCLAGISLAGLGECLGLSTHHLLQKTILIVLMTTYISGYCLSIGSLFWLIISEIYPLRIRGLAMSIVTAIQWAANFIVAITFLTLLSYLGGKATFWLYSIVCLLGMIFVYRWVPETRGISLEKIEQNLTQAYPPRVLGQL